jgi:NADPH:quinone reductase-like Zn-dependent oxidoreductase
MTETMRAVVIDGAGDAGVLRQADVPIPQNVGSEFLVRVVAAGINPIDAKTRAGGGVFSAFDRFPAILGQDFSGVVIRSPYAAHPLQPGDEVYGMLSVPRTTGGYAEYVAVPSLSIAPKPATLSHIEAAAVPVAALTAWGVVVDVAKAHDGQRMLIHAGAGGVGHFAIQFASYFGAHVIATGAARNAGFLRELGAAEVIDYTAERFEDRVQKADVVIDLVGNVHDDTGTRSLKVLRPGGLIINVPSGSWPTLAHDAAEAGVRGTTYKASPDGRVLEVIGRLLSSGAVKVHVDRIFDLADAADAHRTLEQGHTRGKIVLKVSEA